MLLFNNEWEPRCGQYCVVPPLLYPKPTVLRADTSSHYCTRLRHPTIPRFPTAPLSPLEHPSVASRRLPWPCQHMCPCSVLLPLSKALFPIRQNAPTEFPCSDAPFGNTATLDLTSALCRLALQFHQPTIPLPCSALSPHLTACPSLCPR